MEDEDFEDFSSAVSSDDSPPFDSQEHILALAHENLLEYLSQLENEVLNFPDDPETLKFREKGLKYILQRIKDRIFIYHRFIDELNNRYSSLRLLGLGRRGRQPRHPRQVDMRRRLTPRSFRRAMRELAEEDN